MSPYKMCGSTKMQKCMGMSLGECTWGMSLGKLAKMYAARAYVCVSIASKGAVPRKQTSRYYVRARTPEARHFRIGA